MVNMANYAAYAGNHPFRPTQPCGYLNEKEKYQLLDMTFTVHKILDEFSIEHWLMYGSVFGAIRVKGPLPWDDGVEIGFNGSGSFASMKFDEFLSAFKSKGLKVNFKRWLTSNVMKIYRNDLPHIKADLFAMYKYNRWMKRAGLETWIFPLHYNRRHTFPARLVEKPLPEVLFGFFNMPAPKEGIEIQKHLYPEDWWKEVKPVTCE